MNGRFEAYIRGDRGIRRLADERRPDARHRRLAVSPSSRRTGRTSRATTSRRSTLAPAFAERVARRQARGALRRHGGAELLPQAVRSGLGAGRRRRLQQGLHHRAGDQRRVPRRRARARTRSTRRSRARARSTRRWREYQPTRDAARAADVRVHLPSSPRSSRRRPRCSSCSAAIARQPGGDGRLRARQRRRDLAGRVLRRGERRTDLRRGRSLGRGAGKRGVARRAHKTRSEDSPSSVSPSIVTNWTRTFPGLLVSMRGAIPGCSSCHRSMSA